MATVVDPGQLNGLFKEVYADQVENLVPESAKFINDVPFTEGQKLGDSYHQPTILTNEHGITYAGPDAGSFALNSAVALTMKDAQVQGYQMLLRSQISYDAAARASSGGSKAFENATSLLVSNMAESLGKRLEISSWYGQDGIAEIESTSNVSATSTTLQITTASWATGIWSGTEGAMIDIYKGTEKQNTTGDVTVSSVDVDNRTVTVTAAAADITSIDEGSPVSGMNVYFKGSYGNEMAGVNKILTNTGTLFNIDASTYNLWRSNVVTYGSGELTLARILSAVSKAVQRGCNENVRLYVNPDTWQDLNADEAALRVYDQSYKSSNADRGNAMITYYSQNGKIEVVPHNIIKEGDAFGLAEDRWRRIGATDITFRNPGKGGEFFRELNDNAGFELRAYLDQSAFTETPARSFKITGFVNS